MPNDDTELPIRAKQVIAEVFQQNKSKLTIGIVIPTLQQIALLQLAFGKSCMSHKVIAQEFKRLRRSDKKKHKRLIHASIYPPRQLVFNDIVEQHISNSFEYKFTNIDLTAALEVDVSSLDPKRRHKRDCTCRLKNRPCIPDYEGINYNAINCNTALNEGSKFKFGQSVRAIGECYAHTCSHTTAESCGNRYFTAEQYLPNCEPAVEHVFENTGLKVWGLRVRKGYFIPKWGVVGEYTGEIYPKSKLNHSKYTYCLDSTKVIDAFMYGNNTRFINHCCGDESNTVAIRVEFNGQLTVFIRATREICEGEFLSFDYGPERNRIFGNCLCVACNVRKKSTA